MKNVKIFNVASVCIGIINIIAAVFAVSRLPEQVPTHFDFNGVCDGFGSRWGLMFVAVLPLIMSVIFLLVARYIKNQQPKLLSLTGFLFSLFFASYFWLLYPLASSNIQIGDKIRNQPYSLALPLLLSVLLIILGNYTPLIAPNKAMGLRVKWTLANPQCWKATHRFMGKIMVVSGLLTAAISIVLYFTIGTGFIFGLILSMTMVIFSIALSTVFAYIHRNDRLSAE